MMYGHVGKIKKLFHGVRIRINYIDAQVNMHQTKGAGHWVKADLNFLGKDKWRLKILQFTPQRLNVVVPVYDEYDNFEYILNALKTFF